MNGREHAARASAGQLDRRQFERNKPRVTLQRSALLFA